MIEDFYSDEYFMRKALQQAERAAEAGEVPVGAVVVVDGVIVGRAGNQVEMLKDATAHAEMIALTQAMAERHDWRLDNATLYVTKEPCAMCAGAMVNCKLKRVVFALPDPKYGACGSALDVTGFPGMLWRVEVTSGILAEESRALIQQFFKNVRNKKS